MTRLIIILLLIIILAAGGVYYFYFSGAKTNFGYVNISGQQYMVEVADTDEERTLGLQNRDEIGRAEGMLFVFNKPGFYSFWMKDVRFPLDFVWVNNGRVIYINESVPVVSNGYYPSYAPPEPVTHVVEFAAGRVLRDNIKVGDEVEFDI